MPVGAALGSDILERCSAGLEHRRFAGRRLPAPNRDVDERRADLDRVAEAPGAFGRDELRSRAGKRFEHDVAWARVLPDRADEEFNGLAGRMIALEPRLAIPVALPDAVVLMHAVVLGLVALPPAHDARFVAEVPVHAAEHRRRLYPDDL